MSEITADGVSPLSRLKAQVGNLAIDSELGEPIVRLGLITTLYFKNGHTLDSKKGVGECFRWFRSQFKDELKWQFYKQLRPISSPSFGHCRRSILQSSVHEQYIWSLSSGTLQEVAEYRMFVMNTTQALADIDRSCLKMVLPWSILLEPNGAQRYEGWLTRLCDELQVEHGHGGLACTLPCDGQRYFPLEYQLAQQYIGLMVDPLPHIESLRLLDHIKGVSWYTIMGSRFVNQLGGCDELRRQLSHRRDVVFHAYDDGLIIRAGDLPALGGPGQAPPMAYIEVNKVIKPIRVQDTGCLHPYPMPGGGFCKTSSALWYARFDEKAKGPLLSGQTCTHDGFWFSNATAGTRRLFSRGDIMPVLKHPKGRATQWFWVDAAD